MRPGGLRCARSPLSDRSLFHLHFKRVTSSRPATCPSERPSLPRIGVFTGPGLRTFFPMTIAPGKPPTPDLPPRRGAAEPLLEPRRAEAGVVAGGETLIVHLDAVITCVGVRGHRP